MLKLILVILIAGRGAYCLVTNKKFFDSWAFTMTGALISSLIIICLCTLVTPKYKKENNLEIITDAINRREQAEDDIARFRILMEKYPIEKKYYSEVIRLKEDEIIEQYNVIQSARRAIRKESAIRFLLYFGE